MMSEVRPSVIDAALAEIRSRSKNRLYRTDFQAWKADVLFHYTYEKMQGIGDTALFGEKPRTMVKSSNGSSKSFEVADMILWTGSVFEPGEAVSIVSAPSISQLEKVIFAYMKSSYGRARERGHALRGRIDEELGWVYDGPNGKVWLAFGRKPPSQDAVSQFQGVRSQFGETFVFFDEAGGMPAELFTAAEAVMTGSNARFIGIGNPDHTGTEFHRIFRDPKQASEYNLFTLSSFDLPTFTGERVYPRTTDGDAMEAQMLKALTSRDWVEHKKRIWGEEDARYLSKVLGEFAGDGDNTFFPQRIIDLAHNTEIEEDGIEEVILGCDIARYGQDESVVYSNVGGKVRLVESWGKTDAVETARKIHKHAIELGATEVRIDAGGVGGPVYDFMVSLDEFVGPYTLIGVDGSMASPDPAQWANRRAWNHDQLRNLMIEGKIDFDYEDRDLADQLIGVTYKFTNRGGVQITPKDQMKTVMDGSPDRLDAVIYATTDTTWMTGRIPKNSIIAKDPVDVPDFGMYDYISGPGWPMS